MKEGEVSPFNDTCKLEGYSEEYFVDTYSGEIFERGGVHQPAYVIPIDISTIKSKAIYDEIVSGRLYRKRYRLWVSPMLLDLVIEKQLSIPALSLLCLLGQKVGYNNMVYTKIKDIIAESGYVRQTVSSAIGELKGHGLLKEPNPKLENREDRFFLISPLYFYLGYYPFRDNLIKDWIMS